MQVISDPKAKDEALDALVEHLIPGRSRDRLRPNHKAEIMSTMIVSVPLNEATAKVRTGPSNDEKADYDLDVWAGEIPLTQTYGKPVDDPKLKCGVSAPDYVVNYSRQGVAQRIQDLAC